MTEGLSEVPEDPFRLLLKGGNSVANTKTYLLTVSGVGTDDAAEYPFDQFPEITGNVETDATTQYTGVYTDEDGAKLRQWVVVRNKNVVATSIAEVPAGD